MNSVVSLSGSELRGLPVHAEVSMMAGDLAASGPGPLLLLSLQPGACLQPVGVGTTSQLCVSVCLNVTCRGVVQPDPDTEDQAFLK